MPLKDPSTSVRETFSSRINDIYLSSLKVSVPLEKDMNKMCGISQTAKEKRDKYFILENY